MHLQSIHMTLGVICKKCLALFLQPLHETIAKVSWGRGGVGEAGQRKRPRDSTTQARQARMSLAMIEKQTEQLNSAVLLVARVPLHTGPPGYLVPPESSRAGEGLLFFVEGRHACQKQASACLGNLHGPNLACRDPPFCLPTWQVSL